MDDTARLHGVRDSLAQYQAEARGDATREDESVTSAEPTEETSLRHRLRSSKPSKSQ